MTAQLGDIIFWVSVASCAVAQGAIIASVSSTPDRAPADGLPRSRRLVELVWAVMPAIALVLVFGLTYRAIHAAPLPPSHADRVSRTGSAP